MSTRRPRTPPDRVPRVEEQMSFENVTAALGYVPGIGATGASIAYVDAKIVDSIADADTTHAPSRNAVFDALALKASIAYVDAAVVGLWDVKGGQDCSANPNYPAALKGDAYVVTVAGKIGGASGTSVDVGDVFVAFADNAGGTEAAVGTSWESLEHNLSGVALLSGGTFTGDISVPDEAYDATAWNGSLEVPTKNAIRDKIESMAAGSGIVNGCQYVIDTGSTADSDPGAGLLKFNNATQASATVLYLDDLTDDAVSMTALWAVLVGGGLLRIQSATDQDTWQLWKTGTITDASGYVKIAVTLMADGGSFADGDLVYVTIGQGATTGSGVLVQRKVTVLNSEITTTSTIPIDDTKPQIGEGASVGSVSITPTSASNYLKVWAEINMIGTDAGNRIVFAVFKDSGADCLNANDVNMAGAFITFSHQLSYVDQAVTTAAQSWSFRFGGNGNTCTINKAGSASLYGASVPISYLIVEEWTP